MLDVAAAFDRYHAELRGYLRARAGDDADDLAGDVWVKVVEHAPRYQERGEVSAWLYRIARSKAIDRVRRLERRGVDAPIEDWSAVVEGPGGDWIDALSLLARLHPSERAAIWLHHGCGWSLVDTAAALGRTVGAVKALLHRGKARLRDG